MMSLHRSASTTPSLRLVSHAALAAIALAALSACGGGGGSTPPTSTVSGASVAASRYGSTAIVTMSGTNLDSSGLSVTSATCKNMTRLTSGAGTTSTATNAYYSCVVSGGLNGIVQIQSNGSTISSPTFAVPAPIVTMTMNRGSTTGSVVGNIAFTLDPVHAPATVDNFLFYVNSSFYNGLTFHRVVPNFVIQGGGYLPTNTGSVGTLRTPTAAAIPVEITGLNNVQWSLAMANTGGAAPTENSQFYINLEANTNLDGGAYAVFGNITTGIDVAQAIATAPAACTTNPLNSSDVECVPNPDIVISAATQTQ